MSTFKGYVKEFPTIAIDYFRPRDEHFPPVHAYFLSHTHSDHVQGLESPSFGSAFVYCSRETKDILLRIQSPANRNSPFYQNVCKYGHLQTSHSRTQDLLRVLSQYTSRDTNWLWIGNSDSPRCTSLSRKCHVLDRGCTSLDSLHRRYER